MVSLNISTNAMLDNTFFYFTNYAHITVLSHNKLRVHVAVAAMLSLENHSSHLLLVRYHEAFHSPLAREISCHISC